MALKSLVVPKVIHLLFYTKLYNNTIYLLYKMQKRSFWRGKKAKIEHSTLSNNYGKEG